MIPLLGALWVAAATAAAADKPPITPHAEVKKVQDATLFDLELDGPVLGVVILRKTDQGHRVLALVGPPEKERGAEPCGVAAAAAPEPRRGARLFAWELEHPETLVAVGRDIPEGTIGAVDLDGDGADEAVLFGDAGIDELVVDLAGRVTTVRPLVAGRFAPVLDASLLGFALKDRADPALRAVSIGSLTTYRREGTDVVRPTSDVELPIQVYRRSDGFHVRSSTVRPIGRPADGRMRLASGGDSIPDLRRVRVLLLDPEGPPDSRVVEAWARFPSRERALERRVALLDGSPVLIVLTTPADKLSLFGEKLLRVFPLAADRTRAGNAPLLAQETGINLWQIASSDLLDLDGDGRDDLVLSYWKGLKDAIAAFEVRPRAPDGSFGRARSFDFDVPEGDRASMFYGKDLDGDGRPDLALRAGGEFLVYPGSPPDRALDRPVAKVPSRRIPLSEDLRLATAQSVSFGPGGLSVESIVTDFRLPRFVDLDGDGRIEAIFAGGVAPAGRILIVRFR